MSDVSDDILDGFCCFKCQSYFVQSHGRPILCKMCWDKADAKEREKGALAIHPEKPEPSTEPSTDFLREEAEEEEKKPSTGPGIDTLGVVMDFGKFAGHQLVRVPNGYLRWAISAQVERPMRIGNSVFPFWKIAEAEIKRRGGRIDSIAVSQDALDTLSLLYLDAWLETHEPGEGFVSWAHRVAFAAWRKHREDCNKRGPKHEFSYHGIRWLVEERSFPIVKAVK